MKLLKIFNIQENNVNNEKDLLKQINSAYKKLSLQYHPDRTGNDPTLTKKFTLITEVHEILNNPVQRKYYFANHSQIDKRDEISSIIREIKVNAVDEDKQNREAAINVFRKLHISYNQAGLDDIERAILSIKKPAVSSPFSRQNQNLSEGAKAHFIMLLNECKEGIHQAIEKSAKVLEQQNVPCTQRGVDAINAQITQIEERNYDVIPRALLLNANEGLRDDLICAYEYCLTQYRNGIDFVCNAVKKQGFKNNLESLTQIDGVITQLSQGEHSSIPWLAITTNMDELKKKYLPSLALDRLNQYKTAIEAIYEHAKTVMKKQDFAVITQTLRELSNSNSDNLPPGLFIDIPSNKKQAMIAAYHELLLIEHKNFIILQKGKIDVILKELARRVGGVDHEIQTAANNLFNELNEARANYLTELECLDITFDDANQHFELKCKSAIDKAKSVLERDLGWDIYLTKLLNLLKGMANGVIWVVSFGNASNFFKEERRVLEQAEHDLKSCCFG